MKAAFRLAGVEIAIETGPGPLETTVCTRYASYLGAIDRPRCWLAISPRSGPRPEGRDLRVSALDEAVRLDHPLFQAELGFDGHATARVARRTDALDSLLTAVTAVLAPESGALLVAGAGVVSGGEAHLVVGPGTAQAAARAAEAGRPLLGRSCVVVEGRDSCQLASTPFGTGTVARRASLRAIWLTGRSSSEGAVEPMSGAEGAALLMEHMILPFTGRPLGAAFEVATAASSSVPAGRLPGPTAAWERLDEVAAALGIRRALEARQPELRIRFIRRALPGLSDRSRQERR